MIVGDHTIQYFWDCHDPFCEILLNTQHKGTTVGVAHCSNPLEFQAYVGAVYMLESHLNLGIHLGCWVLETASLVGFRGNHAISSGSQPKESRKDDHGVSFLLNICWEA